MSKYCIRRFGVPQSQDTPLGIHTIPNEWQGNPIRRKNKILTFNNKKEAELFKKTITPTTGTYLEVRKFK